MTSPPSAVAPRPPATSPAHLTSYELVLLRVLAEEEEAPAMLTLLDGINPCVADLSLRGRWEARQRQLVDAFFRLCSKGLIERLPEPDAAGGARYVRTPMGRALVGH